MRDFARLNPPWNGEGDQAQLSGGGSLEAAEDSEGGMAQMSKRFHEEGREIYLRVGE
jgi:hypothetical protein